MGDAIDSLNGKVIGNHKIIAVQHKSKEQRVEDAYNDFIEMMDQLEEEPMCFSRLEGEIDVASLVELEESAQKQILGNHLYGFVSDMVPEDDETCQGITRVLL